MKIRSKQQGFALLIFVAILTTAAAALAIKVLNNNGNNSQIARDKITAAALAQAKDALIGYAITYGDSHSGMVHGYLPCPDQVGGNPEGSAELVCGTQDVSVIGRLPWKTLDLAPLRGGDNECLWYAVSGTYKNNPKTGLMNWDTNGLLQVYASDGTTLLTPANNQAVAVIFAPGTTSPGQDRSGATAPLCGGNYTASNYLDTNGIFNNATVQAAANAISQFRLGVPSAQANDQMIFITKQDIWNALQRRNNFLSTLDNMTRETAKCISSFATKNKTGGAPDPTNESLPWAAPLALADYSVNTNYNDLTNLFAGRVPYTVNNSQGTTHNLIGSPFSLLQSDGANCPVPANWAAIFPWWDNWKDQLFYAIGQSHQPVNAPTVPCNSGNCLSVNASATRYAAVVMFAGQKLSGKTRADKSVVTDYLEGRNAGNIVLPATGIENYQLSVTSTTFNDIVYCIKEDLSVVKGDPLTLACP